MDRGSSDPVAGGGAVMARKKKIDAGEIAAPVGEMMPAAMGEIAQPVSEALPNAELPVSLPLQGEIAPPVKQMMPEAGEAPVQPEIAEPVASMLPDAGKSVAKSDNGLSEERRAHLWMGALQGLQPQIDELAKYGISVKDYQDRSKAAGKDFPEPDLPLPPERPEMPEDRTVIIPRSAPEGSVQGQLSPRDRDLLIRTVVGESAGEPFMGQQAVANVVLNRVKNGWGGSVQDVVLAPWQFEPWMTRSKELWAISPDSPAYKQASMAVDMALDSGNDPTNGADHFLNPVIVRGRTGGKLPAWALGQPSAVIGQHAFFNSGQNPGIMRVTPMMARGAPAPMQGGPRAEPSPLPDLNDLRVSDIGGSSALIGGAGNDPLAPGSPIGDQEDDYLTYRQTAGADDIIQQMEAQRAAEQAAAVTKTGAQAAQTITDAAKGAPGQAAYEAEVQAGGGYAPMGTQPAPIPGSPAATEHMPIGEPMSTEEILRGIKETPAQAVGGVFDAARGIVDFATYVADQLDPGGKTEDNPLIDAINSVDPTTEPTSRLSGAVRGITNFMAPFAAFAKMAGKVIKGEGFMAKAARSAVAGAATGGIAVDPFEKGVSDLIESVPALQNPVTEYLQAKPEDTEGEARLKKSLENAGFGVLTDGVIQGLRTIRAWRAARAGQPTTGAEAAAAQASATAAKAGGKMAPDAFKILGDPDAPLVSVTKRAATTEERLAEAAKETADIQNPSFIKGAKQTGTDVVPAMKDVTPETAGDHFYINFSRIDTPDDVKTVIGQMADTYKPQLDEARRGTMSFTETKKLADDMGLSVEQLLSRQKGQPFNAETALAARQLLTASGEKLLETARAAASPNASPADLYAFRRMMSLHYAIQSEVISARTETARALSSWRIPAGSAEQSKAIQDMLNGGDGGEVVSREMAKRLAQIGEVNPDALAQAVRRGWGAKAMSAVRSMYVNALLSSPTTHIVNTMSNAAVAFQQVYERAAARGLSSLRGTPTGVAPGEATAMMFGTVQSIKDAFKYAYAAWRTGESQFGATKVEQAAAPGEVNAMATQTGFGRSLDYLSRFLPVRGMVAEDEFFKVVGYRAEVAGLAVRQAYREGLKGDAYKARVADLISNPPEDIRLEAADAALYRTFNHRLGAAGTGLMKWRENLPGAWLIVPFMRTPANIFKYAMERTPLAPAMKSWREQYAAGGASRDLALAKAATGTGIMLMTADYADKGLITGYGPDDPGNPDIRETWLRTHQPWSVKVGDHWYSYNRMDPLGMTLGIGATLNEQLGKLDVTNADAETVNEAIAAGITALSDSVINKTYLQGISNFVDMIEHPNQYASSYIDQMLGSFVPAAVSTAERIQDPHQSQVMTIGDAAISRIAGLSQQLPPKRDLWGEPVPYASGYGNLYDAVSPIAAMKERDSPIDKEMGRLDMGIQRIPRKVSFDGVPLDFRMWPKVYDEYVKLAGNGQKDLAFGLGAKDFLDAMVSGDPRLPQAAVYRLRSDGPDGGKAGMIRDVVTRYRTMAQQQIMHDPRFADFAAYIQKAKSSKWWENMAPLMQTAPQ